MGVLHRQMDGPHLGPVPVNQGHGMPCGDEIRNGPHRPVKGVHLLLGRLPQGIPAD